MKEEQSHSSEPISRLGGRPEGRLQRYFCIDDGEYHAFSMISTEARMLRRTPKRIKVMGKEVDGWIVELIVPATDGTVRIDPMEGSGKI